jgi:hypothetical protein
VLGFDDTTISKDLKNSELGKIQDSLGKLWNDQAVADAGNDAGNEKTGNKKGTKKTSLSPYYCLMASPRGVEPRLQA